MKTKDLIRHLQEADPSGEIEVCVENVDIHFLTTEPAYYDGSLQVLERDETCQYYNIIGGKYKRTGQKVVIHTHTFQDAISVNHDFPIDYSELNPERAEAAKKSHDELRQWHVNLDNEMEHKNFTEWAMKKAANITEDLHGFQTRIDNFFDKNISPDDPYKILSGHSYITTRYAQWDEKYEVFSNEGFLSIKIK